MHSVCWLVGNEVFVSTQQKGHMPGPASCVRRPSKMSFHYYYHYSTLYETLIVLFGVLYDYYSALVRHHLCVLIDTTKPSLIEEVQYNQSVVSNTVLHIKTSCNIKWAQLTCDWSMMKQQRQKPMTNIFLLMHRLYFAFL